VAESVKNLKKLTPEQVTGGLALIIKQRKNFFGSKDNGRLVSATDLSKILGCDLKIIAKWRDEGCPCLPDPRGNDRYLFSTALVLQWRYETDAQSIINQVDIFQPSLNDAIESREADRRFKVAKALREELELAKEQALVANIDDLMYDFGSACGSVRAKLMSWQSRLPGLLAHKDEKVLADLLDNEIRDVLESLVVYQHETK